MTIRPTGSSPRSILAVAATATAAALVAAVALAGAAAAATQPAEGLGAATSFAVLAGSTVTNTGPSTVSGDVGVSPGTAVTGFLPGIVTGGTIHRADATAASAQADATTAYLDTAGRSPATVESADLGGMTLVPGVYSGVTLSITGTLTLDAQHDPDAVFIFKTAKTLDAAVSSTVALVNGASACNVFWQVGSSATLNTYASFTGTVLAGASITANTGAKIQGRLLAQSGAVTLDTNTVTRPTCTTYPAGPVPISAPTSTAPTSTAPTSTAPTSTAPTSTQSATPTTGATTTTSPATTTPAGDSDSRPPSMTALSPSSGGSAGGTEVTITGTGFQTEHTTITMAGITMPTKSVNVDNRALITFRTPAHAAGLVSLTASTANGGSNRLTYTYTNTSTSTGTHTGTSTSTHTGTSTGTHTGTSTGTHTGTSTGTHTDTSGLASTGVQTARIVELAALLMLIGSGIVLTARRPTIGRHRL